MPVFRRSVADTWRATLVWTLALTAALLLYLPLYPSMNSADMRNLIEGLPPELVQALGYAEMFSGPGYVQATFFGLLGFVFITVAAVSWGSTAVAGAEESGQLELVLSHGVGRVQLVLESALGLFTRLLWFAVFTTGLITILNRPSELGLEPGKLMAGEAAWLGLGYLSGSLSLTVGALTGRRSLAVGAGAAGAAYGYVLNALANQDTDLAWLRDISPYSWAYRNAPLTEGIDVPGLALVAAAGAVFTTVAALALRRRDILG
ncbi:ABC transporter permease subunit [Arthrobacter sp. Sa2CUA1]|uniref:ABC transporter permease subunit n=1 Tax=Arthrobacter gallicola TaxID=2762225 RepID=A0ABR8URZ4_9MICC|nr:ABC transporter permease subunit [Arthrobacter gallicola]